MSAAVPEKDKILLQTFGFSLDEELQRAVAAFVCYLARLSPEHQQLWRSRQLDGNYKLHPDYYRTTIQGAWPTELPIFSAFLMEIDVINRIASAMNRPPLFRNAPEKSDVKGFSFLLRPTSYEYDAFVHLLDKLLSENINKAFFQTEVVLEVDEERHDGKIVVKTKGTLQLLDEWIRMKFQTDDWSHWDSSIATLRKIRKDRQLPAHSIRDDMFDVTYLRKQRRLVIDAYIALRTIRLILQLHPLARQVKVNEFLADGRICDY